MTFSSAPVCACVWAKDRPVHKLLLKVGARLLRSITQKASSDVWLYPKCDSSKMFTLPHLSSNSSTNSNSNAKRKPHSVFEATGREDLRMMLAAGYGSITRYKMLQLAERLHEDGLQDQQDSRNDHALWGDDPAWCEDFPPITHSYATRTRRRLFWFGGQLIDLQTASSVPDSGS